MAKLLTTRHAAWLALFSGAVITAVACGSDEGGDGGTGEAGSGGTGATISVGGTGGLGATGGTGAVGATGGTGAVGATGGTGGSGGSDPYAGCSAGPKAMSNPLIDDFERPTNGANLPIIEGREGYWFASGAPTALAVIAVGCEGDLSSCDSSIINTIAPGADGSDRGFHVRSTGFGDWGAVFGVNLSQSSGSSCPYDMSAFDGIEFYIKGSTTARFSFQILTSDIPKDEGRDYRKTVTLTADWQKVTVLWTDLTQPDWTPVVPFDPAKIVQLKWQIEPMAGQTTTGPFEISIDEVGLSGTPSTGGGGAGGGGGSQG